MTLGRRDFLKTAGMAGCGVTLGAGRLSGSNPEVAALHGPGGRNRPYPLRAPKRLLILGGTGFIGPHMVRYVVEEGHEVSIFTRGRTEADIPEVDALGQHIDIHSLRHTFCTELGSG